MGLYKVATAVQARSALLLVGKANTYTLYERPGGAWYVNFRVDGQQHRLSTGLSDYDSARALIESFRGVNLEGLREVDDKHLYRMIERARYRNRNKGIPMTLGIADLRAVASRCNGRCEVTGHPLEDAGPFRPSLDRIDSSLGYVPGNVRIVCLITNTGMLHYGERAFGEIAIAYCRTMGLIPAAS